uniref:ORF403 n=1 Tax=Rhodomonas salina TaxID=3034 RepID=A6MVT8_RHDSA|nr:ORF403 [Rhodomonas salina]ABO70839.1 ORF403 [Rhodomonas salina]
MNNILEQINEILSPPSIQVQSTQVNEDPVSKLLSSLYSCRGIEVNIKSKDDVFVEDFFQGSNRNAVNVNIDEDLKLFSKPEKIPNFFNNQRQAEFPTQQQKAIITKLKKVPIYTVVNGYNEIVVASPRSMPPKSSIEWLYDKYYDNFLWRGDKGAVNLGLFFVNKEDAETYLQEVCKKDPKGAENIGLSVKTVGLDTFYELNRTSKPKMQARLIADLEEIDLLLNEYSKSKILTFHPKQKYKKQWFQGNPIYLIKINENLNKLEKNKFTLSQYNFDESSNNDRKIVLFRKEDAYKVWNLYKIKNKELSLPDKPSLEIYNLENYLLDLEKADVSLTEKTVFVPPYESYIHSKRLIEESKIEKNTSIKETIDQYVTTKVKSLQRFYKGMIWLVTSDTLPSEDNSW